MGGLTEPTEAVLIGPTGTDPAIWHRSSLLPALPELDVAGLTSVLVVAAHPDDEVLGAGGLLGALAQQLDVHAVVLTDGEGSHPGSPTVSPQQLGKLRREESVAALEALGIDAPRHLGLADGSLTAQEPLVADRLTELVRELVPSLLLAPWRGDGHPDHESTGRAAAAACERTGTRLLEFPVWLWHWGTPEDLRAPWERAVRYPLDAASRSRKLSALAEYATQLADLSDDPADRAVVPDSLVGAVTGPCEVYFT